MRKTPDERLDRLERVAKLFAVKGRKYRRDVRELEDKLNFIVDLQIKNEESFAQNEKRFAQNEERFARNEKTVARLKIQTEKRFAELAKFQSITERRLDELIHSLKHRSHGDSITGHS
jgi:hypothetical protein